MYSGQYVYDILDYNTEIWWRCDGNIINNYSGYPDIIYDDLSHENEQKRGEIIMNGSS